MPKGMGAVVLTAAIAVVVGAPGAIGASPHSGKPYILVVGVDGGGKVRVPALPGCTASFRHTCQRIVNHGESLTFWANEKKGWVFKEWDDDCTPPPNLPKNKPLVHKCHLRIYKPKTQVTAAFDQSVHP